MSKQINILTKVEELLSIGQQLPRPFSSISPYSNVGTTQLVDKQSLPTDFVDAAGRINKEIEPALQTLAKAQQLGFFTYTTAGASFEIGVYYPSVNSGTPITALITTENGLKVQSPPILVDYLGWVEQYVGNSLIRLVDIELELPPQRAWVFFAVIDAARRQLMILLGEDGNGQLSEVSLEDTMRGLTTDPNHGQWIASVFSHSLNLEVPHQGDVIRELRALDDAGYLTFEGTKIIVGQMMEDLILGFLVIKSQIKVDTQMIDQQGEIMGMALWGMQGNSNTAITWTADNQSVNIMSFSPAQMMLVIGNVLEAPGKSFDKIHTVGQSVSSQSVGQVVERSKVKQSVSGNPIKVKKKKWKGCLTVLGVVVVLGICGFVALLLYSYL